VNETNIKKLHLATVILLSFSLGFGATFVAVNYPSWFSQGHRDPQFSSNVIFVFKDASGVCEESESGNLITNIGETMVRNLLGFNNISSYAPLKYISLGNGTVATTLTKLTVEPTTNGFNRTEGTPVSWNNGTDSAFNVTVTFIVSGLGVGEYISVQSAGLHWNETDESDNNMFACAYLTDSTYHQFTNGSTCTVTWVITVDAN